MTASTIYLLHFCDSIVHKRGGGRHMAVPPVQNVAIFKYETKV